MAITLGTPVVFDGADTNKVAVAKFSDSEAVVVYDQSGLKMRHIDLTTTPPTVGSEVVLDAISGVSDLNVSRLDDTHCIAQWAKNDVEARVIYISGGTVAAGSSYTVATGPAGVSESTAVAGLSDSRAVVTWGEDFVGLYGQVLSISGSTITGNSDVLIYDETITGNPATYSGIAGNTTSSAMVVYSDSGSELFAVMLTNVATSFTVNTAVSVDTPVIMEFGGVHIASTEAHKFIVAYSERRLSPAGADVWTVMLSQSSGVVTAGTPVSVQTGAFAYRGLGVAANSASQATVMYVDTANAGSVTSVSISGLTITDNADDVSFEASTDIGFDWVGIDDDLSGTFIIAWNDSVNAQGEINVNILAENYLYLDLSADTEDLYGTYFNNGDLEVWAWPHDDLGSGASVAGSATFGTAAIADIESGARALKVAVAVADFNIVYAFGLDGNDNQVYRSSDRGSSWANVSDGSWTTSMVCVALEISPFNADDVVAVFGNDDIYQSVDGGTTWTKTGDAPGADAVAAERSPIVESAVMAASSTGGDVDVSPNYGNSWQDTAISGGGVVNKILKAL